LPAVWEPKCCATCDNNNFALTDLESYPEKKNQYYQRLFHCRHLFCSTLWPKLFAKTKRQLNKTIEWPCADHKANVLSNGQPLELGQWKKPAATIQII